MVTTLRARTRDPAALSLSRAYGGVGAELGRTVRPSLTSKEQLGLPGTDFELRAERLGTALRGLAAQLVDERRRVAELRRENRELKAQLERRQPTREHEPAGRAGAPADI